MAGIMNVNASKMEIVKNCGVNCCNSKHYIKFIDGIAIIPTWQIFEIERCWKKTLQKNVMQFVQKTIHAKYIHC